MASTFSLIGCGQYGSQNHCEALVSRIRKLMPVETNNETDLPPRRQQHQHHQQRTSDEHAGGNHNTAQHHEQAIPTHFAFHNLDMDDPLLSEALSDLWHCLHRRRRTNQNTTAGTTNIITNGNLIFQQVMWADCEGDQTMERIMIPLQLDLCETAVLYRMSMEDAIFLNSPASSMTTTTTNATTPAPTTTKQSSDLNPRADLLQDLSRNTTLKELRIDHCAPISLSVATLLGRGLFCSGHLETLSIKSCLLDRDTIPILAQGLQQAVSLKYLTLFWSNLWDDQVDDLLSALQHRQQQQRPPPLQRQQSCQSHWTTPVSSCGLLQLDLTGNICRIKAIEAVSKLLVPPPDCQHPPNEGAKVVCLERLCLREQCIEGEKLPIGPLIKALQYNSSLIHLDLSVNKLEDNDLKCLGDALMANTTLQELDVRSNQITDDGVQEFASRALLPVTSEYSNTQGPTYTKSHQQSGNNGMLGLRKLWLQDNPIGELAAMAIRDALAVNFQLEYVGFGEYFGTTSDEIEYFSTLNWGGRRLLLLQSSSGGCSIDHGAHDQTGTSTVPSSVLWPLVLERANKYAAMDRVANIIYCLLRGSPTLFNR
jgi:Leucine Rich repeat